MFGRRAPDGLAGFALGHGDLAVGAGDPDVGVGEEDGDAVEGVLVHGGGFVGAHACVDDADLVVFEFDLIVFGIDLDGVERGGDFLAGSGLLQLDLDDVEGVVGHDFRGVHALGRAPFDFAGLVLELRGFAAVLKFEALAAGLQVDHHAVGFVIVKFAFHVGLFKGHDRVDLIVVNEGGGGRDGDGGGQAGAKEAGEEERSVRCSHDSPSYRTGGRWGSMVYWQRL
jgi:hypothetical protein